MATMTTIVCKCGCGKKKDVRTADVKRGWGLFYSKSCKATFQSRMGGRVKKNMKKTRSYRMEDREAFLDRIHEEAMDAQGFDDFLNCGDK